MNLTNQLSDSQVGFLRQLEKELPIGSHHDALNLVAAVFQTLRQCLTLQYAKKLVNLLPDFLKVVFVSNWKLNERQVTINYLDEFVALLMARDQMNEKPLFKSEVKALSVIILTLKRLDKLIDLSRFKGLSNAIINQIREVPQEEAIA